MSTLTIPFTYILKFKLTNQYYYGVRWARGCSPSELWNTYFSSSVHIKNLIKKYGKDSFQAKVSRTFSNKDEAIKHERRFLEKVKASTNGAFINKRNNMPDFSARGLMLIYHSGCNIQTWHDPSLPIPLGWAKGRLNEVWNKGKKNVQIPWNKGKSIKPTGPCSNSRRSNISKGRKLTKKINCEHCKKEIDPSNYKRFHGNRCKLNPNVDWDYWEQISNIGKLNMKKQIASGKFNNFGRKIS